MNKNDCMQLARANIAQAAAQAQAIALQNQRQMEAEQAQALEFLRIYLGPELAAEFKPSDSHNELVAFGGISFSHTGITNGHFIFEKTGNFIPSHEWISDHTPEFFHDLIGRWLIAREESESEIISGWINRADDVDELGRVSYRLLEKFPERAEEISQAVNARRQTLADREKQSNAEKPIRGGGLICPLLTIQAGQDEFGPKEDGYCQAEHCAWFNTTSRVCSVLSLTEYKLS